MSEIRFMLKGKRNVDNERSILNLVNKQFGLDLKEIGYKPFETSVSCDKKDIFFSHFIGRQLVRIYMKFHPEHADLRRATDIISRFFSYPANVYEISFSKRLNEKNNLKAILNFCRLLIERFNLKEILCKLYETDEEDSFFYRIALLKKSDLKRISPFYNYPIGKKVLVAYSHSKTEIEIRKNRCVDETEAERKLSYSFIGEFRLPIKSFIDGKRYLYPLWVYHSKNPK